MTQRTPSPQQQQQEEEDINEDTPTPDAAPSSSSTTTTPPSTTSHALQHTAGTVFVGGISYKVDEDQLKQCFEYYGTVSYVRIIRDKFNFNQSKGYGFVTFEDPQVAEQVKNEGFIEFMGKTMNVGDAYRGGTRLKYNSSPPATTTTLSTSTTSSTTNTTTKSIRQSPIPPVMNHHYYGYPYMYHQLPTTTTHAADLYNPYHVHYSPYQYQAAASSTLYYPPQQQQQQQTSSDTNVYYPTSHHHHQSIDPSVINAMQYGWPIHYQPTTVQQSPQK
jgi:RNA recognition motif-containing protein